MELRTPILGLGLVIVLARLPRSFADVLAVVVVLVLLAVLAPGSVSYLQAIGSAVFNLFAFLVQGV